MTSEPSPAQMADETMSVDPGEWTPLDDIGTQIYLYGDRPVDIGVQRADVDNQIEQLRRERDRLAKLILRWGADPTAFPDGAESVLETLLDLVKGGSKGPDHLHTTTGPSCSVTGCSWADYDNQGEPEPDSERSPQG